MLDQTGVGRPVVDMFRHAGLSSIGVTITAGDSETRVHADEFRVAKLLLVSRLQAALHAGELRIAKELPLRGFGRSGPIPLEARPSANIRSR